MTPTKTSANTAARVLGVIWMRPSCAFASLGDSPVGRLLIATYSIHMGLNLLITFLLLPLTLTAISAGLEGVGQGFAIGFTRWWGIGGGIISSIALPWVQGLFVALIAQFFGFFHEADVRLQTYISMVGVARLPLAIAACFEAVLMSRLPTLAAANSVSLSALVFARDSLSPFMKAFLSTLNPFDIWYMVLLAVGFAVLQRIPVRKSIPFCLSVYLVSLLFLTIANTLLA